MLANGPGPTVLLRAELDALPLAEETGLPYSARGPAMHACGHDAHLACLAGAVRLLARRRDQWSGTLLAVGQPAEETLTGARAMLDDGLYDRFGRPDVALAQHLIPLPAGTVAHGAGPVLMAGTAQLDVTIHGEGGHAAAPHLAIDPVVTAAAVVTRLQAVVARETNPLEPVVVTVGSLHAGSRSNVIPATATMSITVRAFSDEQVDRTVAAVSRVVRAECAASAAPDPDIAVTARAPVNRNHDAAARRVRRAHESCLGPVALQPPTMASEDFPHFAAAGEVPTAYWYVGSLSPGSWAGAPGDTPLAKLASVPANHSPRFAPDPEPTLRTGTAALTVAALAHFLED
ncbi:hippurate hydrolase [Sphaerisporangium siamense]|uniref:Hippurate hydrolase n=1 Tax=Sphaerisporangium siamense TaxID=795645 RepID=A0A7W7G8F6_9ACTN|nr:hippurate hydrolase [Sphaerisporangium siamense]